MRHDVGECPQPQMVCIGASRPLISQLVPEEPQTPLRLRMDRDRDSKGDSYHHHHPLPQLILEV